MVTLEFASQAEADDVIISSDTIVIEGAHIEFSQFAEHAHLFDKNFTLDRLQQHKIESESASRMRPLLFESVTLLIHVVYR